MQNRNSTKLCCTCLKSAAHLISTSQADSDEIEYDTKLKFCIPEVEWKSGYICDWCKTTLNQVYLFKEQCLKSYEILSEKYVNNEQFKNEEFETLSVDVKTEQFTNKGSETNLSTNTNASDNDFSSGINTPSTSDEDENNIKDEVPIRTKSNQFKCEICKELFKERNLLFLHRRNTHKQEKPCNCEYCDKLFKYNCELKRHELIHFNKRAFGCEICKRSYKTSCVLAKHKIIKHTDPEKWKYICRHCNKKYPVKSNLDQHIRRHHTNASNTYICYHCNKGYDSRILLIFHLSKHDPRKESRMRECHICKKVYINQVILENHLRKQHHLGATRLMKRIKQYKCDKCNKKYTTIKILKIHSRVCDGIKRHRKQPYEEKIHQNGIKEMNAENLIVSDKDIKLSQTENEKNKSNENKGSGTSMKQRENGKKHRWIYLTCEICNTPIGPYKKLIAHAVKEHGADPKTLKPYSCSECNARFSSSTHLARHKKYHTGNRVHICSFCGKGYITKKDMLTHEKLHSNKREVQCEICSKTFHTKSYLRSHKLVVHTDPSLWRYVCPYCGKRFPMKSNYDHHVRRHTGEKPFGCHLCEKRFSDKSVLQQHIQAHSNIRPFKCDYCGKEYKSSRVLGIHLKKVHGIGNAKIPVRAKNFVCDYCSKSFAARDKLRRHMCSHTGERPYSCHMCEKRFTDKSYVKQHLKSVHQFVEVKQEGC